MYFSYVFVSVENWMMRSWPWNGCLRQTSTSGAGDLDDVVAGPPMPSQARRGNSPALTTNRSSSRQAYRDVLVPRGRSTPARSKRSRASPASFTMFRSRPVPGTGSVVVHDEDLQIGRFRELLFDPAVAAAPDLPVVEVRLGRVDGDDRDPVQAQHRVAAAEELLEVDVADVPRNVVPRDHDHRLAVDRLDVALASAYSSLKPCDVRSPSHDDVGRQLVRLAITARAGRAGRTAVRSAGRTAPRS